MIYIRVELWPLGDKAQSRLLGEGTIANVGGTSEVGEYDCKLMKSPEYAKSKGIWKSGSVKGFPRLKLGPWDLLYRALHACVGERNSAALSVES